MNGNHTINLLNLHEEQIQHSTLDLTDKNLEISHLKQRVAQLTQELNYYKNLFKTLNIKGLKNQNLNYLEQITVEAKSENDIGGVFFIRRLQDRFPQLSSNDLRICSLLRENFSTKEIAHLLGVSPDSANKARYRIRKKLGLNRQQPLVNFILSF